MTIPEQEQTKLRRYIRSRVRDESDAEDILQEVFFELIAAVKPIEQLGAWLFRVARNRIIDLFRKRRLEDRGALEDLLPSPDAGPEEAFARGVLLDELAAALEELPKEQREAFIAHEIDGKSFKDLSAETGVSVNTLLSRKRYAVLHLRERLKSIREEFR